MRNSGYPNISLKCKFCVFARLIVVLMPLIAAAGCLRGDMNKAINTFRGEVGPIFCVTFSPDGKCLALGTGGFDARIWDAATGRELAVLEGHTSGISSIAFSPDGKTLALGSWDKTVSLWAVVEAKRQTTIECNGQVSKVAYTPDGTSLAVAAGGEVKLWVLTRDGPKVRTTLKTDAHSIAFTPDGRTLLTAGDDGAVKAWNVDIGEARAAIQRVDGDVLNFAMSHDGKTLALADGSAVVLLDYNAGETTKRTMFKVIVTCLEFHPDGKILAAGVLDKTIKLWDASNGRELATLTGHTGRINSVAFSPDGKTLASASDDRTVKLWAVPKP
jgi:dipeptidyl aminopeptidase/acylaminoacyl peptidase